jgi:hypothetical protein
MAHAVCKIWNNEKLQLSELYPVKKLHKVMWSNVNGREKNILVLHFYFDKCIFLRIISCDVSAAVLCNKFLYDIS